MAPVEWIKRIRKQGSTNERSVKDSRQIGHRGPLLGVSGDSARAILLFHVSKSDSRLKIQNGMNGRHILQDLICGL